MSDFATLILRLRAVHDREHGHRHSCPTMFTVLLSVIPMTSASFVSESITRTVAIRNRSFGSVTRASRRRGCQIRGNVAGIVGDGGCAVSQAGSSPELGLASNSTEILHGVAGDHHRDRRGRLPVFLLTGLRSQYRTWP